jgi:hypothetical protein
MRGAIPPQLQTSSLRGLNKSHGYVIMTLSLIEHKDIFTVQLKMELTGFSTIKIQLESLTFLYETILT